MENSSVEITEKQELVEFKQEVEELNQEVATQIQAAAEILPLSDKIVEKAENMGLVWKPLFNQIEAEMETAKQISQAMNLPNADGPLEAQITNMRTVANLAFLKKERQEYPERALAETLHSDTEHPQQFINLLVNGEGMFFDSQGQPVNLEGYLRDYYQPLAAQGVSIKIESASALELEQQELSYRAKNVDPEMAGTLTELTERDIRIPVLVLGHKGRAKTVPILFSDQHLQEAGAYAQYAWANQGAETVDEVIYVNGVRPLKARGSEGRTIIETSSSVVHEIDHAVFNFLHDSEHRKKQKEVASLEQEDTLLSQQQPATESESVEREKKRLAILEKKTALRKENLYLEFTNKVGSSMIFEGLARRVQRSFMEAQRKGLVRYSEGGGVQGAVALLTDSGRLDDQVYLGMALYGAGEVLTSMAAASSPMEQLYTTDVFDKVIVDRPEVIKALLRHFVRNHNQAAKALSSLKGEPFVDMDDRIMRLLLLKGLGSDGRYFLIGKEGIQLDETIAAEVEGFTPGQIESRLNELRSLKPSLVDEMLNKTKDRKQALVGLEIAIGKGRLRYDEECQKIFE